MRPLEHVGSIKLKLGGLIVVALLIGAGVSAAGAGLGWPAPLPPLVAIVVGLVVVQVLARGMTAPLRQMAAAAAAMRAGDYDQRVEASGVDEVAQLASAFNAMAAELAQVDHLRRDLIANAAHELRTPIAGLAASIENMVDGITAASPRNLSALGGQVDRLRGLVDQLLDLSRLESGAAPLELGPMDLEAVIRHAAHDLSGLAGQHGVVVTVEAHDADLTMTGDETRLRQVGVNLLANALAHSPEGGCVRLRLASPTPATLRLTVSDDGPGIDAEETERIFERFYRADHARSPGGGSGLGLAICRWIVDLHHGQISARPGPGGHVVVDLPRN